MSVKLFFSRIVYSLASSCVLLLLFCAIPNLAYAAEENYTLNDCSESPEDTSNELGASSGDLKETLHEEAAQKESSKDSTELPSESVENISHNVEVDSETIDSLDLSKSQTDSTSEEQDSSLGSLNTVSSGGNLSLQDLSMPLTTLNDSQVAVAATKAKEEAKTPILEDGGVYRISSALSSSMVLDVYAGSKSNGANVQLYSSNSTLAQMFVAELLSGTDRYRFTNLASGKALDVAAASTANGTNVQQYSSNGTKAQEWIVLRNTDGTYTFKSALDTNKVLDVAGASTANGTNIQIYSSNGTKAQRFGMKLLSALTEAVACGKSVQPGYYVFKSALSSSKVMDIDEGSWDDGANVQLYSSNSTFAQRFQLTYLGSGLYSVMNVESGKALTVANSSKKSGANVEQRTYSSILSQMWYFKKSSDGSYVVKSANSGLALDVYAASTDNGTNIQQYTPNGSKAQSFVLQKTEQFIEDGVYVIQTSLSQSKVLDVAAASTANGANVQIYRSNGTAAQQWKVKYIGNGIYLISNVCSGKYLDVAAASTANGANVQQYSGNGTDAQKWKASYVRGAYSFKNVASGKYLDVAAASTANGANVQQYSGNGTDAQRFVLHDKDWVFCGASYDSLNITLSQMVAYQISNISKATLRSLLDPDNYSEDDSEYYQFVDLRAYSGLTAAQLNAFINSTSSGRSGNLVGLGSYFVEAAKKFNINECYLLAHAILESGWGSSELASGYSYNGSTYYNFYGIGAYDSSPLSGGRAMAVYNDWTSPAKAVTGAARWISNNYIYADTYPQYTLYGMKWDYLRSSDTYARGWHQYATDPYWPSSIAKLMNQCYSYNGVTLTLQYVIPGYK